MHNKFMACIHAVIGSFLVLATPLATFAQIEHPNPALIPDTNTINRVSDFYEIICVATSWIMVFGIIIGALFIVWGGVNYITAGGESSKADDAKGIIRNALIGVVFLILAVALVRIVASFFGGNIALDIVNCNSGSFFGSPPGGAPPGGGSTPTPTPILGGGGAPPPPPPPPAP